MFPLLIVVMCVLVLGWSWALSARGHWKNKFYELEVHLEDLRVGWSSQWTAQHDRMVDMRRRHEAELARATEKVAHVQPPPPAPAFPPPPLPTIPVDYALRMAEIMAQVVKDALNPVDNTPDTPDSRRNVTQMSSMTPLPDPDDTDPYESFLDPTLMRQDIVVLGEDEVEPWGIPGLRLPDEVMNPGGEWQ